MFKISISGPEKGRIQKLADTLHGQLEQAVNISIHDAERNSKRYFLSGPRPRMLDVKTGTLRRSVRATMEKGNPIKGILGAGPLPYARIHEFGGKTKPHIIIPKKARILHWVKGGIDMFARVVHHPGSKIPPRPYLEPAVKSVIDRLKGATSEIFTRFGK